MPVTRSQEQKLEITKDKSKKHEEVAQYAKKFFVLPRSCGSQLIHVVNLRHPKTGCAAYFHLVKGDNSKHLKVHELLKFNDDCRSWFCDDFVISDGSLHISSPINPIYLLIPYMRKNTKNFIPFEHFFVDDEYPSLKHLKSDDLRRLMKNVAEEKHGASDDEVYFRFSNKIALNWLNKQIVKLVKILKVHGDLNASLIGDEEYLLKLSWNIISEYLPKDFSLELKIHLKIKDESIKRESGNMSDVSSNKKSKMEIDEENLVNLTPVNKKEEKMSITQKKLAKASASCQSLTSFFKPK